MTADDPQRAFAAALGRIPSGLFILTVAHAGHETGFLASWVQQCSFKPPRLSFAVQPDRPVVRLLTPEAALAFNILEASQTDMIAHFGKGFAPGDDAFGGLEVVREAGKAPVLAEALAVLEGRVGGRVSAGDHDLVLVDLVGGRVLCEGQPMVHIRKNGLHY
jgi:flavin reductase (DIM6/NTAB) family NADH-FMN oxidoreductase RutF